LLYFLTPGLIGKQQTNNISTGVDQYLCIMTIGHEAKLTTIFNAKLKRADQVWSQVASEDPHLMQLIVHQISK